jgi:isoaspartyl peptidase/L-asparaginase-like protein (Ntn-hydrolase superfamily)
VLLLGEGARDFAVSQGFPLDNLNTPKSIEQWEKTRPKPGDPPQRLPDPAADHDTVTVLARDVNGHLGGACSTSGLAHKLPGRVGDSPIIGQGLYVDDNAGAAGATGVGEESMRVCGSHLIVELMRQGATAADACIAAVHRVNEAARRRGEPPGKIAFLAIDPQGRHAAASTRSTGFKYAVARPDGVHLVTAEEY